MKIKLNSDKTTELSKTFDKYKGAYIGLTVVNKKYVKEYFTCAKQLLSSKGKDTIVEQIIYQLSKKNIQIRLCDLSGFNFIEIDNTEDYKKAQT